MLVGHKGKRARGCQRDPLAKRSKVQKVLKVQKVQKVPTFNKSKGLWIKEQLKKIRGQANK